MKFKPEIGAKINAHESLNIPASNYIGLALDGNMIAIYSTRAKHEGEFIFQFHNGEAPHMELIEIGNWELHAELVKTDLPRPFISLVSAAPEEKATPQYRPETEVKKLKLSGGMKEIPPNEDER